ncbi:hypothetical protein A7A76_23920 [Lysobacter enzymogenes]|uniref:hypothetical protein n=1 Tax=Lysobacter enzymogenes TaxID=69 RepID=UPI0019CF6AA2|nr:hypothetical protein [Lysobacter enzymogenes]MBN7137746.1 hypothetical protein [Lysobacter enzymogenes]
MPYSVPATPTDFAGRGATDTATVDSASPAPGLYARTPTLAFDGTAAIDEWPTADAPVQSWHARAEAAIRAWPLPSLAAALAAGVAAGALLRRR